MTSQDLYNARMAGIEKQLDTISRQLKVHSDSLKTWSEAGDLGNVTDLLEEIVDFLPKVQK